MRKKYFFKEKKEKGKKKEEKENGFHNPQNPRASGGSAPEPPTERLAHSEGRCAIPSRRCVARGSMVENVSLGIKYLKIFARSLRSLAYATCSNIM